jgi:hypothetical protein
MTVLSLSDNPSSFLLRTEQADGQMNFEVPFGPKHGTGILQRQP